MNATLSGLIAILMFSTFGVLFVFIRHLPTLELCAILFFIGFTLLSAKQAVCREDLAAYWRRPIGDYIFWLSGAGLYTVIIYYAYSLAAPFEVNALNYLWPILLVCFSVFLHQEKPSKHAFIGLALGFAGALAVLTPGAEENFFADFKIGHALALVGAFLWPWYSARARSRDYPIGFLAPAFFVLSAICAALHFTFEKTVMPNFAEWVFIALCGFARISYAFWDYGMKHGNVLLLASASYFLPLLSSAMLMICGFGPERPFIALGAGLIIAGCLCANADKLLAFRTQGKKTA